MVVFTVCILHPVFSGNFPSQFLLTCWKPPWKQHHVGFNVFCHFAPTCPKSDGFKKSTEERPKAQRLFNLQHSFFSGRVLQPRTNKKKHCTLIGKLGEKKIQAEIIIILGSSNHSAVWGLTWHFRFFSNGKCYRKCRKREKIAAVVLPDFSGWKSDNW